VRLRRRPSRPAPSQGGGLTAARIVLLTRPGCHLCDDARAVVEQVAADVGVSWAEVSIEDDPDLRAEYAEQIPVTFVDGRQHDYWRVDPHRLRRALGA
jgi:glutaredoxin